jgi:uncharacterized membrane protein
MTADSPLERALDEPTAMAVLLVLGLGFLTMFAGVSWFWMIFVFGFAVIVPLVAVLYEDWDDESDVDEAETTTEDPLETLRDRYARDELTDEQFERKLDRLLETESISRIEHRERERERAR